MAAARLFLFLAALAVCGAAADASATAPPDLYRLTVTGQATVTWDLTTAPTPSGDCATSLRTEGVRTVQFHSTRTTLLRFSDGRIATVGVHGIGGTVTTRGSNTTHEVCDARETSTPDECGATTRHFSNARTTLSSGGRGLIVVASPRVALQRNGCEPKEVAPLGPTPVPLHVSTTTLANERTVRITLTASATRTRTYRPPAGGILRQRAAWKLTLVRVRP